MGRAVARRRPDEAAHLLAGWRAALGAEVADRGGVPPVRNPGRTGPSRPCPTRSPPGCWPSPATREYRRLAANAVRHLTPAQAPVVDVLDAIRRLVPLDPRHLDRANAQGYLKDDAEMQAVGAVAGAAMRPAGRPPAAGATRELADSCRLDPAAGLGIELGARPRARRAVPGGAPGLARGRLSTAPISAQAALADRVLRHRCEERCWTRGT